MRGVVMSCGALFLGLFLCQTASQSITNLTTGFITGFHEVVQIPGEFHFTDTNADQGLFSGTLEFQAASEPSTSSISQYILRSNDNSAHLETFANTTRFELVNMLSMAGTFNLSVITHANGEQEPVILKLVDLVPAVNVVDGIDGMHTDNFVQDLTPEKAVQGNQLNLNIGDKFRFGVSVSDIDSASYMVRWKLDGRVIQGFEYTGHYRSVFTTSETIALPVQHSGIWTVDITASKVGEFVSEIRTIGSINMTVDGYPTAPNNTAENFACSDTNIAQSSISCRVTWTDTPQQSTYRSFDFYVVYLSPTNLHTPDSVAVLTARPGPLNFAIDIDVDISGAMFQTGSAFLHLVTREVTGQGADSVALAIELVDMFVDDPVLPLNCSLVDINGRPYDVEGFVSVFKNPSQTADTWEVYSGTDVATTIVDSTNLQTVGDTAESPQLIPVTFNMNENGSNVFVFGRSSSALDTTLNGFDVCNFPVEDLNDVVFYLDFIQSATTENSNTYGPRALGGVQGNIIVQWVVPSLISTDFATHVVNGVPTPLVDLTEFLTLDVALGQRLGDGRNSERCALSTFPNWPAGAPTVNFVATSSGTTTLFSLSLTRSQLLQCGFSNIGQLSLHGAMSVYVRATNGRQDAVIPGRTPTDGDVAQYEITALLTIGYDRFTEAFANVSVSNIIVFETEIDVLIELDSSLTLFTNDSYLEAFGSTPYYEPGDRLVGEHLVLGEAADRLYLTMDLMWFSFYPQPNAPLEFSFSPTDEAYTNIDSPQVVGRYRFATDIPFVLNCLPCYLHAQSAVSVTPSLKSNKLPSYNPAQTNTHLIIEFSGQLHPDSAAADLKPILTQIATALVLARLFG